VAFKSQNLGVNLYWEQAVRKEKYAGLVNIEGVITVSKEQRVRGAPTNIDPAALKNFKAEMRGSVLAPDETGYDEARKAWNTTYDQHPALVALVAGAPDVIAAVNFAREQNLRVAVQSTGHGIAYPCDGGLLINTSRMTDIQIDPQSQTARVEPGVLWGDVVNQVQAFGLAALSGFAPNVGVIGYTLGGGFGWLVRKYGLAANSVRSVDLVTADGQQAHVSDMSNSDLFWGLRGGGGNFGIVTSIEFALYPVVEVFGGRVFYPVEMAKEVLSRYSQWVETIPYELTSTIAIMHLPSIADLPEPLRGKAMVIVGACYAGSAEDGAALLRPIREFGSPVVDTFAPMRYADTGTINSDPVEPQGPYGHTELIRELSSDAIDKLVEVAGACSKSPLTMVEIRHLGGAVAQVDRDANAISHRDAPFVLHTTALGASPEDVARLKQFTAFVAEAMRPFKTGGALLNFLGDGDVGEGRVRAVYSPEHYRRLVELKDKYDPENFFRLNHNIPPSSASR